MTSPADVVSAVAPAPIDLPRKTPGQLAYEAWHTGPNGEHEEGWMPWEKAPWRNRWERAAAPNVSEWIPVAQGLPVVETQEVATWNGKVMRVSRMAITRQFRDAKTHQWAQPKVTHWMPLPAPPEANRGAPAGATARTTSTQYHLSIEEQKALKRAGLLSTTILPEPPKDQA